VSVRVTEDTVRLQKPLAASPTPKRRYKVGVLFPFMASPFWVNEAYGVLNQAEKLGVEVVWLSADGYDNVDKQSAQLEDLATQKVDAILIELFCGASLFLHMSRLLRRNRFRAVWWMMI
jgi:ABC-type sugar transport system substrate-binding protein